MNGMRLSGRHHQCFPCGQAVFPAVYHESAFSFDDCDHRVACRIVCSDLLSFCKSEQRDADGVILGKRLADDLPGLGLDWKNTSAIICASARRIKAVARDLMQLGMKPSDIYTALETNMHCGIGKCGHCKVGSHYMCVDGPVFTYEEMLQLPPEF